MTAARIDRCIAVALIATIVTIAVSVAVPPAKPVAGGFVLAAAALGLVRIRAMSRYLALALIVAGVAGYVGAGLHGHQLGIIEILSLNQDLIAMLAGLSLLGLVTNASAGIPELVGAPAVWRTAAAVHLLGSVINISSVAIIGDHLADRKRLSMTNALLLSRAFSTCAFWSPFWAAAAAAASFAPGAHQGVLLLVGGGLALLSMGIGIGTLIRTDRTEIVGYHGYALTWALLRIPLALVVIVVTARLWFPQIAVTNLVLLGTLVITVAVLLYRDPRTAAGRMVGQATERLPRTAGETTLFAAAAVLSGGLGAYFESSGLDAPFSEFTVLTAWCCTVLMTLLSFVGIHPVVSIAALAALLAPIDPNPTMYAMASMIAWGFAAAVGPVSGLNVTLSARYDVSGFVIARRNLLYLAMVIVLAWPALWAVSLLT